MKRLYTLIITALIALTFFCACNDTSTIGESTVQATVQVTIDSAFTVTGKTQPIGKVQSRTIAQLLGRIDAKGFGRISSDVVTQFMPSSKIETDGVKAEDIDSLILYMYMVKGEYVGDSITPMGLDIYRLTRDLPSPIYSDFNPEGYYTDDSYLTSAVYNIANQSNDTIFSNGVEIKVKLPLELGREIYTRYLADPSAFNSPTAFTDRVFKGLYLKNSFGSGRLLRVSSTIMTMYFHRTYFNEDKQRDTTVYKEGRYFAVTPEIITNNDITIDISPELQAMADDGQAIVSAPVGMQVNIRYPAPEILASLRAQNKKLTVLNTLSFSIPAEKIANDYGIEPPAYLLMVLTKDMDKFFANNLLPDNTTSFYASYNANAGKYDFGEMRAYINSLADKDNITEDDYAFTIMPVSCTFETSQSSSYYYYGTTKQTLSMVTPYVSAPVMGRLNLDQAKIKLTFSTQSIHN